MAPRVAKLLAALASASLVATGVALGAGPRTPGNVAVGKSLFVRAGIFCGSCHTLAAAKSKGRDGPDLDRAKASYTTIRAVITKGARPSKRWPTGMPGYGGAHAELTKADIRDVAAFVYRTTH